MIMNTMACIATQPQNHKSFTSGNRTGASGKQTWRLLRAFALLTICTIAFYAAPVMGSERTKTQTKDTCKLTGSSHIWSWTHDLILKAEETSEYSDGEFIFFIYKQNQPFNIVSRVPVSGGEAQFNLGKAHPGDHGQSFTYYAAYVPPKGEPRRDEIGCESNGWGVFVR
jgi:hypothetical protein